MSAPAILGAAVWFACACGNGSGEPPSPGTTADASTSGGDASGPGQPADAAGELDAVSTEMGGDSSVDASVGAASDARSTVSPSTSDAPEGGTSSTAVIENDVFWKDTSGNFIYSQGGGVLQAGKTFYWYGVRYGGAAAYASSPATANGDSSFVAVTCYSSTDLAHWTLEGDVLTRAAIGATGWVGRIGAAYNAVTKKYVLVTQYRGTNGSGELFATSPMPNAGFVFDHVQATLTNVVNGGSGDQSVFVDDDGQAYLIFSNINGRSKLYVAPLRAADFLNVEPATQIFTGAGREGNCMYKFNGRYYFNSSDLHGWNASHTYYVSSTNIFGPYSTEAVLAGTDSDFSHVTQTGLFVTVRGTAGTTVVFGGDRWSDFAGNGIGYNQWNPIAFNGATPQFQSLTQWSIDVAAGTWQVGPQNNYVLNPSFEADRVATTQPAGWTAVGGAAASSNASGGRTGNWKWRLTGGLTSQGSLTQTITGLPAGTYTLAAWVRSSGGGSSLFAQVSGQAQARAPIGNALTSWTRVSVTGIQVSSGSCQIGAQAAAGANQWLDVDDVTLLKN